MSVSSISGVNTMPPSPEASEVKQTGPDHDGDADDGGAKAVKSTPTPTVNTTGQKLGQIVNVKA